LLAAAQQLFAFEPFDGVSPQSDQRKRPPRPGAARNQSIRKAVALLRAVAQERGGAASISALARAARLPRATALRLVATMEEEGFLLRADGSERVMLGPELLAIARRVDRATVLTELAREPLRALAERVRETVTLSVVSEAGELELVHQVDGPREIRPRPWIGQRFPAHASSSGKILLASLPAEERRRLLAGGLERLTVATITDPAALEGELERVRASGYATTVDELEEGLSGVSVGVHGKDGELVAVVNVSGPTQRLDRERLQEVTADLREVADQLRRKLVPDAA
jgi:DNA-binding IclR family transcriptional regulator